MQGLLPHRLPATAGRDRPEAYTVVTGLYLCPFPEPTGTAAPSCWWTRPGSRGLKGSNFDRQAWCVAPDSVADVVTDNGACRKCQMCLMYRQRPGRYRYDTRSKGTQFGDFIGRGRSVRR